jgi:AcrR family transcriptional regulator
VIFDPPTPLPRGPHQLTREQVAESQRTRLMVSMTELMAERGYAGVSIGELAHRAGVSRTTFYVHFADKQDCVLAAYDRFAATVITAITPGFDQHAPWRSFIEAILDRYLAVLERDLTATRAFFIEMDADPVARRHRREATQKFAALLAERHAAIRARNPKLGPLPQRAYLAIALAVRDLVHETLEQDANPNPRQLAPGPGHDGHRTRRRRGRSQQPDKDRQHERDRNLGWLKAADSIVSGRGSRSPTDLGFAERGRRRGHLGPRAHQSRSWAGITHQRCSSPRARPTRPGNPDPRATNC